MKDLTVLDNLIVGRVEPHIYAFSTNTIPNYLKVGDTYRPVPLRLKEWKARYPDLQKQFEDTAKVTDDVFFRDYSVHKYLENDLHKKRLDSNAIEEAYYSNEFFEETVADDVAAAIENIKTDYALKENKYQFYNVATQLPTENKYPSAGFWDLRPNQKDTVKAFEKAKAAGRTNLLMYAVMRFGKSFTSMCCAKEMNASLVVVVSAKADVQDEWRKTVECAENFRNDYEFLTSKHLKYNDKIVSQTLSKNSGANKVVLFLTLQDLQGRKIKDKHQEIFGRQIDLLLVDETHFGARAEKFGQVLKPQPKELQDVVYKGEDEFIDIDTAEKQIKTLDARITIHLSGTPYRILMGSEFKKEDIIAFCQFTDIVEAQQKWDQENLLKDDVKEWDNPYYGFPQMIRFAFNPNESSIRKLNQLKNNGATYAFSALFKPKSIKKSKDGSHTKFENEQEILDLLAVIDGSQEDENLLGFLDYDKIKQGKMCRHIVIVLPYCASCDALECLINDNITKFKNLNEYHIINISGVDNNTYRTPREIKSKIKDLESLGIKTITLTVNRMLTGSTVPEWDTMIYLKDTASPQEYDQAIFRLQNQYIKEYKDSNGDVIKFNMKPQTLLVDFDPNRMFVMQEEKSKIYNANVEAGGNTELKHRMDKELEISPIIYLNHDKMERVQATDILNAISNYNRDKGIKDEALETPVDLSILNNALVKSFIEKENEIGSKSGLTIPAIEPDDDGGTEIDVPEGNVSNSNPTSNYQPHDTTPTGNDEQKKQEKSFTRKIQSFYTRILLYAFITQSRVISLCDVISSLNEENNSRIARNLGLNKEVLVELTKMNPFTLNQLDYKIQDLNDLSLAADLSPEEKADIAVNKFGKLGDAIVITPRKICNEMVNLIPSESYHKLDNKTKILDIAGTSGEFAVAIFNKMKQLGIAQDIIKDSIYTITKSSICYELTRKLYEMLGLNTQNIAKEFIATDLLDVKIGTKIDYNKIKVLITQNKPFETIKLTDTVNEGEIKVKFEAIVGNPPYQEGSNSNNSGKNPIYHYFIDTSQYIGSVNVIICPARFLFNAGKTPKDWNQKILENEHYKVVDYWVESSDVFPSVDIKGGVAITLYNKYQTYESIGVYTAYKELRSIIKKVINNNFISFADLVYPRDLYHLTEVLYEENEWAENRQSKGHRYDLGSSAFEIFPELFFDKRPNDSDNYAQIYGRKGNERTIKWINRNYIKVPDNFDKYKIFIPKSNGSGAIGEVPSTPIVGQPVVGQPMVGHTVTFLSIGKFETVAEATATLKYIKSKFARTMLGTLKVTQDNPRETWLNVPLQDFTDNSDIDWSKSVAEIDQQLYKKYNLSEEEINFIETMIKPMN